ncbi:CBS domain-containing protein [Alicycliphilus denitrificans]|uniref:CBS domain-containing protein n=1 Tax=Alicycliphilus denitrificans TaxID=179636 RepID=UPI0001DA0E2F|nr:CBS domain-containing protein [Alicycliphilus denitrificans]ADV01081.1 CBS domain containing protein [Alicycliphilus denitrificans BC]
MFFVFGPAGQVYRGGAHQLPQVLAVSGVQRPQALSPHSRPPSPETGAPAHRPGPEPSSAPPMRQMQAAWAYAQTGRVRPKARRPLTQVSDVMTREVFSLPAAMSIQDAWQALRLEQLSQAPVVDARGQVVGLLRRSDMASADLLPDLEGIKRTFAQAHRPITDVMLSPAPTVSDDTDLRRVAKAMLETGLSGLPVTDEAGMLQGFVARSDILRALVADPPLDLWS